MPVDVFSSGEVMQVSVQGLREAQQRMVRVNDGLSSRGMEGTMRLAVGQVHRYLMGLKRDRPPRGQTGVLPVWTGRLANSMFMRVTVAGNTITGNVGTNVRYAPVVEERRRFIVKTLRDMRQPVTALFAQRVRMVTIRG